ncbi:MAG: formate dehydrogenase accessory sulfurtransferase FdhD [Salibacteraceae bacterium]
MAKPSVTQIQIKRFSDSAFDSKPDILAIEEPMEIRLTWFENSKPIEKSIAVAMRTPGNDLELALGFLFTEGIINSKVDIDKIWHCETVEKEEEKGNVIKVNLKPDIEFDFTKQERHFYTSSSCGVCGKASIESVNQNCSVIPNDNFKVNASEIKKLTTALEAEQTVFKYTGGIHASALFNSKGVLIATREDVGRHNALDKIAGWTLENKMTPLNESILLVSGRASFELVQKAIMLGIPVLCAVGAPSNLAVDLAKANNMTLIGFLKTDRFNIYTGENRILL